MSERLIAKDADRSVHLSDLGVERIEYSNPKLAQAAAAVATLRGWSGQAASTTVTSGNAVATLQVVVDRLGVFFDRFADLVEHQYIDKHDAPPQ